MKYPNLTGLGRSMLGRPYRIGAAGQGGVDEALFAQVDAAHREWQAAQQYFEMVCEPELVDHAIFTLEAAQRKYRYLYQQLRHSYEGSADPEA